MRVGKGTTKTRIKPLGGTRRSGCSSLTRRVTRTPAPTKTHSTPQVMRYAGGRGASASAALASSLVSSLVRALVRCSTLLTFARRRAMPGGCSSTSVPRARAA